MDLNRRSFLSGLGGAALCLSHDTAADAAASKKPSVAFFEKPLQSLPARDMAKMLADIGFNAVEATVRPGGRIDPERAADLLPDYVEALRKEGLQISIMATQIQRADQKHADATLRAAAKLGLRTYRLGGESYDLKRPLIPQLDELRKRWLDLAALNAELGLTAVYQNHAGGNHVGAAIWDLQRALDGIDPDAIGVAYDIRHAMVEGMSAWPIGFELTRPQIRAIYVKDFRFEGRRPRNVPMGDGVVGTAFYKKLKTSGLQMPLSLHCPHVADVTSGNRTTVLAAIRKDFSVLNGLLGRP